MLRKIEPQPDGKSNFATDDPKAAWDTFLGGLGDIARAPRATVDQAVDEKVKARQTALAAKRQAKRSKDA